jgi:hypothetical protein
MGGGVYERFNWRAGLKSAMDIERECLVCGKKAVIHVDDETREYDKWHYFGEVGEGEHVKVGEFYSEGLKGGCGGMDGRKGNRNPSGTMIIFLQREHLDPVLL